MSFIKSILMGLGVIFILAIVGFGFLFKASQDFKVENMLFVERFLYEYSARWEISDVEDKLSAEYLSTLGTREANRAIAVFKNLGELQNVAEVDMIKYNSTFFNSIGTFILKAEYEYAETVVTVVIRKNDVGLRVMLLSINTTEELNRNSKREIAT